jgi:hypothetical protein
VSFAATALCVASHQVFIVVSVYFIIDSVRKLLDTPSYNIPAYVWRESGKKHEYKSVALSLHQSDRFDMWMDLFKTKLTCNGYLHDSTARGVGCWARTSFVFMVCCKKHGFHIIM